MINKNYLLILSYFSHSRLKEFANQIYRSRFNKNESEQKKIYSALQKNYSQMNWY